MSEGLLGDEAVETPYVDEEIPAVASGWIIQDTADADWALKRLGDFQREMDENKDAVEAAIARLRMRLDNLNAKAAKGAAFFEGCLLQYAQANKGTLLTGRKKSRVLPHGTLGFRRPREGLSVTDAAAFVAWAEANSRTDVLRVHKEPALAALNEAFRTTGEVPPGTEPKPTEDKFYAEPVTGFGEV